MIKLSARIARSGGIWWLLVAVAVSGSALASDVADSEKLIRSEFDRPNSGRWIRWMAEKKVLRVEVCFDGCDYFEWKRKPENSLVWDFIALYEYEVGLGSDIESFKTNASEVVPRIVERARAFCRQSGKSQPSVDCKWAEFANSQGLRVGVVIRDEGMRCFAWKDLRSMRWPTKSHCAPLK